MNCKVVLGRQVDTRVWIKTLKVLLAMANTCEIRIILIIIYFSFFSKKYSNKYYHRRNITIFLKDVCHTFSVMCLVGVHELGSNVIDTKMYSN